MVKKHISSPQRIRLLHSASVVSNWVAHHVLRGRAVIVEALKTIAKFWAFFKDIHFSWFVMIPLTSSVTSLGKEATLLLWILFFLPILVVTTFTALDSLFDRLGSDDTTKQRQQAGRNSSESFAGLFERATTPRPRSIGATALHSQLMPGQQLRRHSMRRPIRSRRPGIW